MIADESWTVGILSLGAYPNAERPLSLFIYNMNMCNYADSDEQVALPFHSLGQNPGFRVTF